MFNTSCNVCIFFKAVKAARDFSRERCERTYHTHAEKTKTVQLINVSATDVSTAATRSASVWVWRGKLSRYLSTAVMNIWSSEPSVCVLQIFALLSINFGITELFSWVVLYLEGPKYELCSGGWLSWLSDEVLITSHPSSRQMLISALK